MSAFANAHRSTIRSLAPRMHRCLHSSAPRHAVTNFQMPAMSPTMTAGGVSSWKVKEGAAFAAGDVLLEVETDKATIDVEAQEDGVLGKILVGDGAKDVEVGKIIALLAEEGDDISNLEEPKEQPQSASKPQSLPTESTPTPTSTPSSPSPPASHSLIHPTHSRPLFPSVQRILSSHGIRDASKIKGTGIRGMLTKGDVLAHLGLASGPLGSAPAPTKQQQTPTPQKVAQQPSLDGLAVRRLIVAGLQTSLRAREVKPSPKPVHTFDTIISAYLPRAASSITSRDTILPPSTKAPTDWLHGLV